MESKLTNKQIKAYKLCSGEFEGRSTVEAAVKMLTTPQAVNRLLNRAAKICPSMFPLLTKQEADARALLASGCNNYDVANKLEISLSRVSQIINILYIKRPGMITQSPPIKMLKYETWMDSQTRIKF